MVKGNFSTLILFELLYKGLAFFITPIMIWLLNISLRVSGIKYLSINNVIKLINPISILIILTLFIVLAFYLLFEFISIIICFDKSINGEKVTVLELIKISLNRSIEILHPKNILLVLFVLIIIPLTNIGLTSTFIGKLKLPDYIQDFFKSNTSLNLAYIIAMIVLYLIVVKWIFSIHEMALSTRKFNEARSNSIKLTKGHYIKIVSILIGVSLIASIIGLIIYRLMIIIVGLWTKYAARIYNNQTMDLKTIFINRCFILNDYAKIIFTISIFIINMALISTLYYKYKGIKVKISQINKVKKSIYLSIFKVILIIFLIQLNSLIFSMYGNTIYNSSFFYNTKAVAHRASASMAPENTIAALKESIDSNAEYAEIDVQETKDGELIIIHDSNFKRTTGVDKNVWEVNYDEVKTYDAGSFFDQDFAGERIPTLEEMIKYSKGKINLVIEIKLHGNEKTDVVKRVIDLIKENEIEKNSIIASMDKEVLKAIKNLDSKLTTCYLAAVAYGDFYNLDFVDIYAIESTFVNREIVDNIHNEGKKIFVWTINNQDLMRKMINIDVDSIITDNPYLLEDTIYWEKNGFVTVIADKLFN